MKVFGLTGGIGMGKSTAGKLLRERGVPVVDTDDLARKVVEPGQPALRQVVEAFGPDIVDSGGNLRREELARKVFADAVARSRLEAILHPPIRRLWQEQMEQWRSRQYEVAVVIIPLLFETGAEADVDATICLACRSETQRKRLLERGWSAEEIERRVSAQMPIEEKMQRANYLVWSEGSVEVLAQQLERVIGTTKAASPERA